MYVQEVRLRAVALPVLQGGRREQSGDAAAGFVGADGPGGQGGDFPEVGGEGRRGGFVCEEERGRGWLVGAWNRIEGGGKGGRGEMREGERTG